MIDIGDVSRFEGKALNDFIPILDRIWWHYPYLRRLNFSLICAMLTQITNGFDGSMLNGLQSVPTWSEYFGVPTGAKLGSMTNGVTYGRSLCHPLSLTAIIGAVLQGAAQAYPMFVVARFLIGMAREDASFIEPAWHVGSFFAVVITYGTYHMGRTSWAWLIQCAMSLIAPESPPCGFFVKYHAGDDRDSDLAKFQMAEVTATLEAEKWNRESRWTTFFKTKGMRHRLLITVFVPSMMQLSGNGIMSYYLTRVLNDIGLTVNLCGTVWSIFTAYAFASQVDRIGRRKGFLYGLLEMQVSCIVWTAMSTVNQEQGFKNRSMAIGIIAVMYIYLGFYHLTAPFAPTYVAEVLPYSLRAKGTMLYHLCASVSLVFNNYVNPTAMDAIEWKYYIVFCVWIGVEALAVYFTFPETGGELRSGFCIL
ncbi:uncharacterized protein V2V93DRAFT_397669 [Kockiozyma suomiensis]|uniref:uncharacterized protein n=1 Tax=Kockiozyma suomiensis TaxID=1337062 RepID=UPI003344211E